MNIGTTGKAGEDRAARYLQSRGYRITGRNVQFRSGEIDIIAENDETIVFAEVKTRKSADFAEAREYVGRTKQQRILRSAMLYLAAHDTDKQPRFDVIEVYLSEGLFGRAQINHIENAFM